MYTRWRPVPSARTVRILYQLGYICSGTAVGLATLCLEEQRRRIQILQRIADSAKVIRQHPRYRGNVALALETGEEYEPGMIEVPSAQENLVKRRIRRRRRSGESHDGAIEGPHLPSVVEREYSKMAIGSGTETYAPSLSGPSADTASKARLRLGTVCRIDSDSSNLARTVSFNSNHTIPRRPAFPISASVDLNDTYHERNLRTDVQEFDMRQYRMLNNAHDPSSDPSATDYDLNQTARGTPSFDARSRSDLDYNNSRPSGTDTTSDDVSHDVRMFFSGSGHHRNALVAHKLFRVAVDLGSLGEVQDLWKWKLAHHCFTRADAEYLYESLGTLGTRHDRRELSAFFQLIFTTKYFSNLDLLMQLEVGFNILARYFKHTPTAEAPEVHQGVLRICQQDTHGSGIPEVLSAVCKTLAGIDESEAATNLFIRVANPRNKNFALEKQLILADDLFNVLAVKGRGSHLADILRWKAQHVEHGALLPMIDSFVQYCGQNHANQLLFDVFGRRNKTSTRHFKGPQRLLKDLSPDSSIILAVAFCMTDTFSEGVYRSLARSTKATVHESVIKSLKYLWRTTHDFKEVERGIQHLADRLERNYDETSLKELDETALEIYVSASRMDLAMETLRRMQKKSTTSNLALCQTALMFAKQGSWQSFSRVVDMIRKWPSFHFDEDTMRAFNTTLHVYCQYHGAEEIWKLMTSVVRDLGFTPNFATSEIILGAFVLKQRFDFIPKWAELLSTPELQWEVQPNLAASLLRRYYVDHRPSHVFMMLLCRKLAFHSPAFACDDIKRLVEQAIAYDLRHLSGTFTPRQRQHAQERLRRLGEAKSFIPSPGFVWNAQLYFHDSQADVPDFEVRSAPVIRTSAKLDPTDIEDDNVEIENTDEPILDDDVDLQALRSNEGSADVQSHRSESDSEFSTRGRKKLEGQMWSYMSTGDYDHVLQLYRENLDEAGIPASPIVLELAVEASLKRDNGDESNALRILSDAKEAGMNTTCATGPLVINQLKHFDPNGEINSFAIRQAVVEYYQSNDENGWRVNHHLGTSAAHTLIQHNKSHDGLGLLSSIYTSQWVQKRPLDVVALTVFLKGYIHLQSVEGVRWVVDTILEHDIRITNKFIKQLRWLSKGNYKWMNQQPEEMRPLFDSWVQSCVERQKEQTAATHQLGWELAEQIAKCSNDKLSILKRTVLSIPGTSPSREEAQAEAYDASDFVDESYYSDESAEESAASDPLADIRQRIIEDWNAEQVFRRRLKAAALARGTRHKDSVLTVPDLKDEGGPGLWHTESDIINDSLEAQKEVTPMAESRDDPGSNSKPPTASDYDRAVKYQPFWR